ncbi:hypothetical protein L1987_74654 [Smallanthus sonchifolius]|uniref:Uncharacterized protein n=1 Tax=Smallanthus sonchifolius TaxID=185202 RepID=A0ACB9A3A2_9ASTR|nr:hypothetical protein L1987_74654 [Smallanthus sonchifolius]
MHEAHQFPPVTTPSLVSMGTQTDETLRTDVTKKGEIVTAEDDADNLDEWIQEQAIFQSTLFKHAFVQIHDLQDSVDEEEDISEDWKLVVRDVDEVLENEKSSRIAEQILAPRLDLIGSRVLTEEQVLQFRRFFYNEVVKGLEVQGWSSTGSSGFQFFLCDGSSFKINNIQEILLPNPDFLYKIFELRTHICNIDSLESQAMIKIIKAFLENEVWIAMDDSDSDLSLPSSPTVILNAAVESRKVAAQNVKEAFKAAYGNEWEKEESEEVPSTLSTTQIANEAEAEILTTSLTSAVVINEVEAEAFNKDKGKGIMTEEEEEEEEEERIEKEKKEKEKKRRER